LLEFEKKLNSENKKKGAKYDAQEVENLKTKKEEAKKGEVIYQFM